jgi:hypothetical protein
MGRVIYAVNSDTVMVGMCREFRDGLWDHAPQKYQTQMTARNFPDEHAMRARGQGLRPKVERRKQRIG